jgi:hypothetical protein
MHVRMTAVETENGIHLAYGPFESDARSEVAKFIVDEQSIDASIQSI